MTMPDQDDRVHVLTPEEWKAARDRGERALVINAATIRDVADAYEFATFVIKRAEREREAAMVAEASFRRAEANAEGRVNHYVVTMFLAAVALGAVSIAVTALLT